MDEVLTACATGSFKKAGAEDNAEMKNGLSAEYTSHGHLAQLPPDKLAYLRRIPKVQLE